jgi:hypothetical protein
MAELWNRLARVQVDRNFVSDTLDVAFPMPARIEDSATKEERELYVKKVDAALASRDQTRKFFDGAGTGMDMDVTKGTAYGLYNSIVELIDWGGPIGSGTRMATVRSAAMGMAYQKKQKVLTHMAEQVAA